MSSALRSSLTVLGCVTLVNLLRLSKHWCLPLLKKDSQINLLCMVSVRFKLNDTYESRQKGCSVK
jgi:hypothetical protein